MFSYTVHIVLEYLVITCSIEEERDTGSEELNSLGETATETIERLALGLVKDQLGIDVSNLAQEIEIE